MLSPVQKKFIWAGVVCLSLLALFPPWCSAGLNISCGGYAPIFYPPNAIYGFTPHIDYLRLLIPMGLVVLVTFTGVFLTGGKGQSSSRPSDKE